MNIVLVVLGDSFTCLRTSKAGGPRTSDINTAFERIIIDVLIQSYYIDAVSNTIG